jgi:hypothetical protein
MTYKSYSIALLLSTIFLLLIISGFNRLIDPFWYYQDSEIKNINQVKTKVERFERHVKPQILQRRQVEAIILGSSFSEIGFDPQNMDFNAQGQLKGYNFAFAGSGWARTFCYFKYAIQHAPVQRIVLGIHPQTALPMIDCAEILPEIKAFSQTKLLLSLQALKASISTLRKQKTHQSTHTRDGLYYYTRGKPGTAGRFHEFFKTALYQNKNCRFESLKNNTKFQMVNHQFPTQTKKQDFSGLQHLMQLAIKHKIDLNIFAYPKHALSMELDILCQNYQAIWSGLATIADLTEIQQRKVNLWAFFSYNAYTTERIINKQPIYWQDPEHFNFEFGDQMLKVMFKTKPQQFSFGYQIRSHTIKNLYAKFNQQREKFLQHHPQFLTELHHIINR